MGLIGGALLAVLIATLSRLLADDFKAWVPRLTEYLIRRAVRRLPEDQRERLAEEWTADVADTPGDLAKLVFACGLKCASRKIASDYSRCVSSQPVANDEHSMLPAHSVVSDDTRCGNCGEPVIERTENVDRLPCPRCGSTARMFSVQVHARAAASVTANARVIRGP
jgi:ribosomal protein S27AE